MMGFVRHFLILLCVSCLCLNLSRAQTNNSNSASENADGTTQIQNPATPTSPFPQAFPQPQTFPAPQAAPLPAPFPAPATTPPGTVNTPTFPAAGGIPATTIPINVNSPPGAPAPGQPAVNPSIAPGGGAVNLDALLKQSKPGKYEEYLSICRSKEFDHPQYQNGEEYTKKVFALRAKLNAYLDAKPAALNDDTFALVEELIDFNERAGARRVLDYFRNKVTQEFDIAMITAYTAFSREAYAEARKWFLKALEIQPKNKRLLLVTAQNYLKELNFFEAGTIFDDLNQMTDNLYLAEQCEVMILNSLNADAEKICMQAAKKFRSNPFPLVFAGVSARERQDLKRATAYFRLSLKIKSTEMAHVCLAEINLIQKDPERAIESFKKALLASPRSPRAYLGMAAAQLQMRRYDDALESYRQVCKISGAYEIEVRKAYRKLVDEKNPISEKFIEVAQNCSVR